MTKYRDDYGFFDKALHYLAFTTSKLQLSLARQESEDHAQALSLLSTYKPVFITSLPRGGTTILLDILTKTEAFSYHTYQDMPFVFTPLLWSKFSGHFAKDNKLKDRAHNDGIKINQNSAEAFEEMLWQAFWPQNYNGKSIALWQKKANVKFDAFFVEHIKKLHLRDHLRGQSIDKAQAPSLIHSPQYLLDKQKSDQYKQRYISKNNLNISRLPYLKQLFPDSIVLTPFREPLQHALSMLKQHKNFSKLHSENAFSRRYMAAIGHFDFGVNLKPVNFNQWHDNTVFKPDSLDFWLEYWIETYHYLLDTDKSPKVFISFEHLCENAPTSLKTLAQQLDLPEASLQQSVTKLTSPKAHAGDVSGVSQKNLSRASALYQRLLHSAS